MEPNTRSVKGSGVRRRRNNYNMLGEIQMAVPPPNLGLQPSIPRKERGSMHVIDQQYESLDYDTCPNQLYLLERMATTSKQEYVHAGMRMAVCCATGVLTACIAVIIDVAIHYASDWKFSLLQKYFSPEYNPVVCLLLWCSLNLAFVIPAALLGSLVEPVSAGSGIPQVKCYLNGVKIPRVVRIKTLVCKAGGVVFSVLGGLFVGKEGPMIHSGAVVAAGISQGKSSTFNKDFNFFHKFREDHEKRDFVACGAAAGVAAAFGAPIGGVLFALEEGASHWQQSLTWNSFVSASFSVATLNILLSLVYHRKRGGLLDFGQFDNLTTTYYDVPVFCLMAAFCGLYGSLFNALNKYITKLRMRYHTSYKTKVAEVMIVSVLTCCSSFALIYFYPDCKNVIVDGSPSNYSVQLSCPTGQESMTARLLLTTPEEGVIKLFHDSYGTYGAPMLVIHFLMVSLLSCYTYGLGVPSGLFIPTLLAGASFGRLCGVLLSYVVPGISDSAENEGKYALVGAAALLGGVVRMTLSLTCIMMECVGAITFTIEFFVVIHIAKFAGDLFNKGLYDIHVRIVGVPFLEWKTEPLMENLFAHRVMSKPPICVRPVESVRRLLLIARRTTYNGFPVVWDPNIDLRELADKSPSSNQDSVDSGRASDANANATSLETDGTDDGVADVGPTTKNTIPGAGASDHGIRPNSLLSDLRRKNRCGHVVCDIDEKDADSDDDEGNRIEDIIDNVLGADALVLQKHYAKKNALAGLNSEAVLSQLLTDSCINRFARENGDSDNDAEEETRRNDVPVVTFSLDDSQTSSPTGEVFTDTVTFDSEADTADGADTADQDARSQWYNTSAAPADLGDEEAKLDDAQGILCGIMLRSQIMVMLKHKMFIERAEYWSGAWDDLQVFREAYPRFYDLEAVDLRPEDLDCYIDLRRYMNPAPYSVTKHMNLPRVFNMFRSLGLRHLTVVDSKYRVKGMITRKDLVQFHARKEQDGVKIDRMNVHKTVSGG